MILCIKKVSISMSSFVTSFADELCANAKAIASTGKGILAADESTGTYDYAF
jgi:hypothetical protein